MSPSRSRNGFVLIATCIALVILMALAGLAVDIGRMYVIKSELQAFADSAALTAAVQLNNGPLQARNAVQELTTGANAMKWDLGSRPISDFTLAFAQGDTAPDPKSWQAEPKDFANRRFVRVIASAPAPLIFLRPFVYFQPDFAAVSAASIATNAPSVRLVQ